MTNVLERLGAEETARLRARAVAELTTTFASHYAKEVSLAEMLRPEEVAVFAGAPTRIRMTCASPSATERPGGVEAGGHAGENGEAAGRRHGELALFAEIGGVALVGGEDLIEHGGHGEAPRFGRTGARARMRRGRAARFGHRGRELGGSGVLSVQPRRTGPRRARDSNSSDSKASSRVELCGVIGSQPESADAPGDC